MLSLTLLGPVIILSTLFIWAAGGIQNAGTFEGEVETYGAPTASTQRPSQLKIMTWNISYAYGEGSEGVQYHQKDRAHFVETLEKMGKAIRDFGADVVLIQEIDFGGKRVNGLDELAILSEASGLSYGAKAPSWKAGYVPFPYWPPKDHFGKVVSGGAILSRFPIERNQVTLFPRLKEQPWWYRPFYPFRYYQWVELNLENRKVRIVNTHLEAFLQSAREEQAQKLVEFVQDPQHSVDFFGGDFNTTPPEAKVKGDFGDYTDDHYDGDRTLQIFRTLSEYSEVIPVADYVHQEDRYFTFPASKPNRRLDYFFTGKGSTLKEARVLPVGNLSDHLPLGMVVDMKI